MVFAIQDFSILDGVEDLDIPDLSQRDHQGILIQDYKIRPLPRRNAPLLPLLKILIRRIAGYAAQCLQWRNPFSFPDHHTFLCQTHNSAPHCHEHIGRYHRGILMKRIDCPLFDGLSLIHI